MYESIDGFVKFGTWPLAAAGHDQIVQIAASLAMGAALFVLARTVTKVLSSEDLEQDDEWRYDVTRINELRRASPMFRFFQPVIQLLATGNRRAFRDALPEINREIQASGLCRFWTAEEYIGRIQVICLLVFPAYFYVFVDMMGTPGTMLSVIVTVLTGVLLRHQLAAKAAYRLLQIKRRMPYLLDLLTLLMEAGSTFLQALDQACKEFRDHAVGVEFGRVLMEMRMGKNRTAAFEAMKNRLQDDEITSIIGSIVQGEELGTPLATLFRSQSDILRIKRTQRAETLANEAGVKMLLPAVMVMAATVLIILGPFIISFLSNPFSV